jgi:hypothetical protein
LDGEDQEMMPLAGGPSIADGILRSDHLGRIRVVSCCKFLLIALIAMSIPFTSRAHVGSPNVFFEGKAGNYPVHVVIRPPEVIPGLAEISVRIEADGVERVTALPIKWNAGRQGAPPPDVARAVRGDTNLYTAQLWFMEGGAQSVEIEIAGASGIGRVTVPVDAVANRVLRMPPMLGGLLAALGLILVLLFLSIVGAAVRDSVLTPGVGPTKKRCLWARLAIVGSGLLLVFLLWGGKKWWDANAADYRNNRLYKPMVASARVRSENNQRILRLEINDERFARSAPLVPDHGKLMHLFLIREPKLDAFAHLHPLKIDRKTFEAVLAELPSGSYRLYADITYETGFSDTLTTAVEVPEPSADANNGTRPLPLDSDDSWKISSMPEVKISGRRCPLGTNFIMTWSCQERAVINRPVRLVFTVSDTHNQPVILEPYLGMRGHLALRREDGAVFTHLHPGGSASMAAMQLSVLRTEGKLPLKAAFGADDPLCQLPAMGAGEQEWLRGVSNDSSSVAFPYAFPRTGWYRLWVQVKIREQILTGIFDVEVLPGKQS